MLTTNQRVCVSPSGKEGEAGSFIQHRLICHEYQLSPEVLANNLECDHTAMNLSIGSQYCSR